MKPKNKKQYNLPQPSHLATSQNPATYNGKTVEYYSTFLDDHLFGELHPKNMNNSNKNLTKENEQESTFTISFLVERAKEKYDKYSPKMQKLLKRMWMRQAILTPEELSKESPKTTPEFRDKRTLILYQAGILSKDDMQRIMEERKKKLKGKVWLSNEELNPETFLYGVKMTRLILKAGARNFSEYSKVMIEAIGDEVRPHLKGFYEYMRRSPEGKEFVEDMTPTEEVDNTDVFDIRLYD